MRISLKFIVKCFIISIMYFLIFNVMVAYTQFTNWYDLPSGVQESSIALGDIDSDGDLDLVITGYGNGSPDKFIIYTNNGTGILNESQNLTPPIAKSGIALGDIDSDNDLDLIISGYKHSLPNGYHFKIFKNNGVGIFNEFSDVNPNVGYSSIELGDIDIDGDLDLIMTGYDGSLRHFKIYKNDGIGNFLVSQNITLGGSSMDLALGDINKNGFLDLVIDGYNMFKIFNNSGTGYYTESQNLSPNVWWSSISLGDINANGNLDIIMTGTSGGFVNNFFNVYTNNSQGYFYESQNLSPGVCCGSTALGDIDSDGYLDLIMTGGTNVGPYFSKVYKNNGMGNFSEIQDLNSGVIHSCIALGDIDNDGDLDLVLTGLGGGRNLKIYRNTNSLINNVPYIPGGMKVYNINGYWRFMWNTPNDDHTLPNMLRYKIAIGIKQSGVYNYSSTVIDYPQGQANIGNVPQAGIREIECYYQSKIPIDTKAYWKVCALDTSFKSSGYCLEQIAEKKLNSKIIKLEPSEGKFFYRNGKIIGKVNSDKEENNALDYVEIRIKNINKNLYWDGAKWTSSTNIWLQVKGKEEWEYYCKGIPWEFGELYYVEAKAVAYNKVVDISEKVEFIPVYQLTKWSFCNYPNPFDPNKEKTCIEYLLLKNEEIRLLIYEISGRIVKEWKFKAGSDGAKEGLNRIYWDGKNDDGYVVANGVYFCYLKKKSSEKMTKIMVVK